MGGGLAMLSSPLYFNGMTMGKRRKINEIRTVWDPLSGKLGTNAFWILGHSGLRLLPPPQKKTTTSMQSTIKNIY